VNQNQIYQQQNNTRAVFLYVRVSTLDQIGGAESQARALTDWCGKNNIINFEIFTDHGISGAKESRPALNRMIEKIDAGLCSQVAALLIGCYSRVSTDEQANVIEGSLDNQRHRMQSFIDIKNMQEPNWGHLVEYFVDDGYSAKDTNRPAYARMMKALKSGKIDAVMVTELSRLSRNIPDFCDFHKMLESQGAKFFSIKEQFDSSTPAGKMMLYNMINLAQFEREQTSERVAINCHSRAQRGLLNGGPAILGYDKDPAKKATFLVNEQEAKDVRRIFELFIEQRSLSRTIDAVAAENIKPKVRENEKNRLVKAGRWTIESLSFVLKNKAYIAVRDVNKVSKNKDQSKLKAWQKFGSYSASWPAIVDEVMFNTTNTILAENFERERMRLDTSASQHTEKFRFTDITSTLLKKATSSIAR